MMPEGRFREWAGNGVRFDSPRGQRGDWRDHRDLVDQPMGPESTVVLPRLVTGIPGASAPPGNLDGQRTVFHRSLLRDRALSLGWIREHRLATVALGVRTGIGAAAPCARRRFPSFWPQRQRSLCCIRAWSRQPPVGDLRDSRCGCRVVFLCLGHLDWLIKRTPPSIMQNSSRVLKRQAVPLVAGTGPPYDHRVAWARNLEIPHNGGE